ncbi:gamma-glutamyltranspeptidase [Mrakia frigida]|uniref:gamma-glutamyltransferase family protein n=1 Tax=Mrakia frigida TaxID=29902 RepID=UPI003FCC0568
MSLNYEGVYKPQDPTFSAYPSRRSVVFGTKGIVAASQPLAVQAGLEILAKGGNAADAAVATAAALNVTEPSCTGIGGDMFCLFYSAKDKTVLGVNGSGRSPKALTMNYARSNGITGRTIPLTDLNSVTVPGTASGWCTTIEEFGSGKVTMAEILAPAIRMAEEGVPVSELHSHAWQRSENLIKNASPSAGSMLLNGRAPQPGEIMRFPDLATTFKAVAKDGRDGFYKGRIAEAIVELIKSKGGVMEVSDLEEHTATKVQPIKYTYKNDVTVHECPPNGQGLTALLALGILDEMEKEGKIPELAKMEHNSVEYLHTLIEALRLSFADTRYYVTDPEKVHVPVDELLSEAYLKTRAGLFDPSKAGDSIHHGKPVASSDTVYFTTADEEGNACSFIQSNYAGFGTGAIPKGCGFTLQNRGSGFTLEEGHPNELKGGKRPYHTIIPAMATRGDELFLSYGVMGGFMQPQGHVQVLLNVLRGMTVQAALDAPRFCISAGLPDSELKHEAPAGDVNSEVYIEEGIPVETINKLKEMGHDARPACGFSRGTLGRGQIIQLIKDKESGRRVWAAGSDLRGDGHAAAQI